MNKDNKVKQILREYLKIKEQCKIYIVWKYKVLQYTKWLLSVNNLCYEITYNKYKNELYVNDNINKYCINNPFKK